MEFRVLGPIEVYSDESLVHVGGVKQRSILALLIANRGHIVSADRIVDEIYSDDAASGARRSVQSIISMLRRDLGDAIVGTGDGYRFDAADESVDVYRFEDRITAGVDLVGVNPGHASSLLSDALGLWRGDPYGDVDGRSLFQAEIARLSELRFTALEARIEADLACGRHRQLVAELEALVADCPLLEHSRGIQPHHDPHAGHRTRCQRDRRWRGAGGRWPKPRRRNRSLNLEQQCPHDSCPVLETAPSRQSGRLSRRSKLSFLPDRVA